MSWTIENPGGVYVGLIFEDDLHVATVWRSAGAERLSLIGAAPDLLEALEELLEAWDDYEMLAALDIAIQRKAEAAIAKAKGENNATKKDSQGN